MTSGSTSAINRIYANPYTNARTRQIHRHTSSKKPIYRAAASIGARTSQVAGHTSKAVYKTSDALGRTLDCTRPSIKRKAKEKAARGKISQRIHRFYLNKRDESGYFEPKTIGFWRNMLMYLFIFAMVGHAMEIPYCNAMGALFGIVEEDYAAMADPWYIPYWVYGVGAVALSLIMVPLKIKILEHRKTLWGACLEFFVLAVLLCAILETVIGLIINQPNELGVYPYWDNSALPLNILGQGWIVNDLFLGIVSVIFVWGIFPICQKFFSVIGNKWANRVFIGVAISCAACCIMAYAVPPLLSLLGF